MGEIAVQVEKLNYAFQDKQVLKDVSLKLESDKIYGLLGRNGAGKTTLISVLTNGLIAKQGKLNIFGKDPRKCPEILEDVCVVQDTAFYAPYMKVREIFELYRSFYPLYDRELEEKMVDYLQLPIDRAYQKYSKGMKTLVFDIIGLCSHAKLTIFDEPTVGLDAIAREYFYDRLLDSYNKMPRTIILSTHLIDEVENLLENVVLFHQGSVLLNESVDQFKEKACYLTGQQEALSQLECIAGKKPVSQLGKTMVYSYFGKFSAEDEKRLQMLNIEVAPMKLQEAFVELCKEKRESDETIAEDI